MIRALREKQISGVAVDVFDREPASTEEDSAFLAEDTSGLNLTLSPHMAYYSTKKAMVKDHIKNFVSGNHTNFEV